MVLVLTWREQSGKIQVLPKDQVIKILGRSPDYSDPVVMSLGVKDEASDAATAAQSARESRLEDAHGPAWRRRTGRKARWSDKRLPYPSRI